MKKLLFLSFLTIVGAFFLVRTETVNAQTQGCVTPPTDTGRVTLSVTGAGGTYRVWSRMKTPDSSNNSFYLQIDNCAVLVGNSSSIPANTWTWVDYRNGSSSNKIDVTLNAGTHVVTLIGNEDGVGVDKILMTQNLTCVPSGTSGDNCPGESNDTNAPAISNISASEVTDTTAKINWFLDEFATGQVEYGTSTSYGSFTQKESSFNWDHHIQGITGLTNGVTYHYRVISTDSSGNTSTSGDCTFTTGGASTVACSETGPTPTTPSATNTPTSTPTPTTPSTGGDTTPPVISNLRVEDVTGTTAKIRWELDEYASGVSQYRPLGSSTWLPGSNQTCCTYNYHIQSLSGFTNGTTYEYRVTSVDASGNSTTSNICTFLAGGSSTQACGSAPTPQPDLIISSASITNQSCNLGTSFTVKNVGDASTVTGFKVNVNGTIINVSALAAGQTTTQWTEAYEYSSNTNITVDSSNDISEKDEANNSFNQYIPVPTQPPSCISQAPTNTPNPTPLPSDTVLRFQSIKLHGIGLGGDNTNANSLGNINPLRTSRQLSVELIDSSGNSLPSVTGNIAYRSNTAQRDFIGDIVLSASVSTGSYLIKIKSPQYLKKQVIGIITVTKGAITNVPSISLTTGDIDNNNALTIADYNILIDCYSDLLPAKNCADQNKKTSADLSDDGNVNANDYNLFLRELSVVSGD